MTSNGDSNKGRDIGGRHWDFSSINKRRKEACMKSLIPMMTLAMCKGEGMVMAVLQKARKEVIQDGHYKLDGNNWKWMLRKVCEVDNGCKYLHGLGDMTGMEEFLDEMRMLGVMLHFKMLARSLWNSMATMKDLTLLLDHLGKEKLFKLLDEQCDGTWRFIDDYGTGFLDVWERLLEKGYVPSQPITLYGVLPEYSKYLMCLMHSHGVTLHADNLKNMVGLYVEWKDDGEEYSEAIEYLVKEAGLSITSEISEMAAGHPRLQDILCVKSSK
jgi:hypothetical protein